MSGPDATRNGEACRLYFDGGLAVHDKAATDRAFRKLLSVIERGAFDERNFVKKAVNWALRNIGKRNRALNAAAIRQRGEDPQRRQQTRWRRAWRRPENTQRPLGSRRCAPRTYVREAQARLKD